MSGEGRRIASDCWVVLNGNSQATQHRRRKPTLEAQSWGALTDRRVNVRHRALGCPWGNLGRWPVVHTLNEPQLEQLNQMVFQAVDLIVSQRVSGCVNHGEGELVPLGRHSHFWRRLLAQGKGHL